VLCFYCVVLCCAVTVLCCAALRCAAVLRDAVMFLRFVDTHRYAASVEMLDGPGSVDSWQAPAAVPLAILCSPVLFIQQFGFTFITLVNKI
jgi:hypothetical protein